MQHGSKEAADAHKGKLTAREYDEVTWATRSFGVFEFVEQRIAVALQMSVAEEIALACGGGLYRVNLRPRREVVGRE